MFTIQYWNPSEALWLGCGEPEQPTREAARARMRALLELCDYVVSFRVVQLTAA